MELRRQENLRPPERFRESGDNKETFSNPPPRKENLQPTLRTPREKIVRPRVPFDPTLRAAFPTIPLGQYPPQQAQQNQLLQQRPQLPARPTNFATHTDSRRQSDLPFRMMGDNMPSPHEQVLRWEAIADPGDFEISDELDDAEFTASGGRAPFLRGYLSKDDSIYIDEEYDGWVAREDENSDGEMETRYFIKTYEGRGVQWCELSDGIKLIIVRELTRFMTLQDVGEYLELTDDEKYAFAALCDEERKRRAEEDTMIRRINQRQFALFELGLDSKAMEERNTELWEEEHTKWREEHNGNDPVGPSTFSISRSEIQLAKRFLSDYRTREDFSVAFKERKYLPTANDMEEAFRRIQDYEGTSTSYMDLDFDDFDGVYDEDEDDVNGVPAHASAPPASGLELIAALSDDDLEVSTIVNQESVRPAKKSRQEDATYTSNSDEDSGDESDASTGTSIVVGSRSALLSSSVRVKKKNPRGRPRGSTKKQKELQKSPRKKFADPEAWDGNSAPYHLLPKQKTVRPALKKVVKLKLPGSKLSQFLTPDTVDAPSPSSAAAAAAAAAAASRKVSTAPPDPKEKERRSLVDSLVGPAPPAQSLDPVVSVKEPIRAPDSSASQGLQSTLDDAITQLQGKGQQKNLHISNLQVAKQRPVKLANHQNPRPTTQSNSSSANIGPIQFHPQAHKQGYNAPALPQMITPQAQATKTSLGQPQRSSHPQPAFCGPTQDTSKGQIQQEGVISIVPASTPSFGPPSNSMGTPHPVPPKSNKPPSLASPFQAQNSPYNQWLKENPNSVAATAVPTPPDTSLERQKAHIYQNSQTQAPGYAAGIPAPNYSAIFSGKQPKPLHVQDKTTQDAFTHMMRTVKAQPNGITPGLLASTFTPSNATPAVLPQGNAPMTSAPEDGNASPKWSQPLPSGLLTGFTPSTSAIAPPAVNPVSNQSPMYTFARPTPLIEPQMRKNPSPYSSPGPAKGSMGVLVSPDQINLFPEQPKQLAVQPPVNGTSTANNPINLWENGNAVKGQGTRVTSVNNAQKPAPNRHIAFTAPSASFSPSTPRLASNQRSGVAPSNSPFPLNTQNSGLHQQRGVAPGSTTSGSNTQRSGPNQQSGVTPSAASSRSSHTKQNLDQPEENTVSQPIGGSFPVAQSYQEFFASSPLKSLHPAITPPTPSKVVSPRPINTSPRSSQSPVNTSDSTVVADSAQKTPALSVKPLIESQSPPSSASTDTENQSPSSSASPDGDHSTPPSSIGPDPENLTPPSIASPGAVNINPPSSLSPKEESQTALSSVSPGVEMQTPPSSDSPPAESQIAAGNKKSQIIDLDKYVPSNTLPKISATVKIEDVTTPKKVTSDLPLMKSRDVSPNCRRTSITRTKVAISTALSNDSIVSSPKANNLTAPSSNPAQQNLVSESTSRQPSAIIETASSSTEHSKSNESPLSRSRPSVVIPSNASAISPEPVAMASATPQSADVNEPLNRTNAPTHIDLPASEAILKSVLESSVMSNSTSTNSKKSEIQKDASTKMLGAEKIAKKASKAQAARGRPPKNMAAPRPASPMEFLPAGEPSATIEKAPATKERPPKKSAISSPESPPLKHSSPNDSQTNVKLSPPVSNNSKTKSSNAAPKSSVSKPPAKSPAYNPLAVKASAPKASGSKASVPKRSPVSKASPAEAPAMIARVFEAPTPRSTGAKNPATKPSTGKALTAKAAAAKPPVGKPSSTSTEKPPASSKKRKAEDEESVASAKPTKKSKTKAVKDEPEASSAKPSAAKTTTAKNAAPKMLDPPRAQGSKAKAAKAAGPSLIAELEDLQAQKQLGAPPPILNERSRSQVRAVRDGTAPPPSPKKAVQKRGRDDSDSAEETEVVEKIQRIVKKGRKN